MGEGGDFASDVAQSASAGTDGTVGGGAVVERVVIDQP
jgi:hypothetical protein